MNFQVELKLSKVESFYEKELVMRRNNCGSQDEDQFDALETVSNEFTYGLFNWTLSLRPQPILLPVSETSSWAGPIKRALQQQRMNNGQQDLDHLGLSVTLQRQAIERPPPQLAFNNNRMAQVNALNLRYVKPFIGIILPPDHCTVLCMCFS